MAWGMFKWRNRGPCGVVTLCLRMGLTHNWSCSPQRNVGSNSRTFRVCNPAEAAVPSSIRLRCSFWADSRLWYNYRSEFSSSLAYFVAYFYMRRPPRSLCGRSALDVVRCGQ
ncbi:hypothetical protein C1H46_015177 [Malus baccata]|uniref:Secreted protein n=1 Tax=Malus baccata TaxID=106549 RepID=A0A540MK48_MALBA|nr:hypothetical protein C1H46_015177 [Malus baccata]